MTPEFLKIICLNKIAKNLYKIYLICLNRFFKIPSMIAQQIHDNLIDDKLKEKDYLFFSKEICSLNKIYINEHSFSYFISHKMKINEETIKEIHFFSSIRPKIMDEIAIRIHLFKNLQSLYFKTQCALKGNFELFCTNLYKTAKNLRNIYMYFCRLEKHQVEPLLNLLEKCDNLQTLYLFYNQEMLTDKLFHILKTRKKLLNLDFSSISLRGSCEDLSQKLARLIYDCPQIAYIDLRYNKPLKQFFFELEKLNEIESREFSLEKLNVSYMELSKDESIYLEKFLTRCKRLKIFIFKRNTNLNFCGIFESLKVCKESLQVIEFNDCRLSEDAFQHLLNLLSQSQNIKYLRFTGNVISLENLNILHKIVKEKRTIQKIELPKSREILDWMKDANLEFGENNKVYVTNYPCSLKEMIESLYVQ